MATAVVSGAASTSKKNLTDEEQRWVVVGICLTKILTPALRKVLSNELPRWHRILVNPPVEIDKQTPRKFEKNLPPSTIKLNYESINNNSVHKSPKLYDYTVKDPLSLAKLFMKPFMSSSVTGFDHTMDTSAVLSVMCEAQPFHASGASVLAKKVRSDIRNEWAHCDFSYWTDPNFQTALNDIEHLVKKAGLATADEKIAFDDIDKWRNNGTKLNFGDPADCELLWTEVGNLKECFRLFNEDSEIDKERLLDCLQTLHDFLNEELCDIRDRQANTEENVGRLNLQQLSLNNQYISTVQDVEIIKNQVAKITTASNDIPYVFNVPKKNNLFGGRSSELQHLASLLRLDEACKSKVKIAAVCGLGGVGKTSLATEYAHQKKEYYTGGVYWFSGEDDTAFENSMYDVATHFGTQSDLFGLTTLKKISQNKNPWLIILDNMDQSSISANIFKLVSGPWQHDASGQLLIITRRKPTALANDIQHFDERRCLSLQCFGIQEGKKFLLRRIGRKEDRDKETDAVAEKLVEELGGLPLALEQAGAYIKSLQCTLSQYLELYDRQRLRLLSRQKARKISVYDSDERLAVRTTWHLNFEHIEKNVSDGKAASRFLYASAFLNPDEIQKDIINVGEPPVEDEQFNECIKTTLGRQQVVKLLTDFSLFKETLSSSIRVHRLVQEVIQDNFRNSEEEVSSLIDAVRMLHFAFQSCSSPDELISFVTDERQKRPSIVSSADLSRFYKWHKLCVHSYELVKNIKRVVTQPDYNNAKIFHPEAARIIYECAVHLSANSKHDAAIEVANFASDIFNLSNQEVSASFFPHILPLPELVRRQIQYSCNAPVTSKTGEIGGNMAMSIESVTSKDLEEMRLKGNDLYKRGLYDDALNMYGGAIDMSRDTTLFDIRLLSNRASVYIKLELYKEALQDAEEYILLRPKCWKGYARKAVALVELNDTQGARVAASLAYYYERNVFRNFEPMRRKFGSLLEKCLFVCRNNSDLSAALQHVTSPNIFSLIFSHISSNQFPSKPDDLSVIILAPGDYLVSLNTIDSDLFEVGFDGGFHRLMIGNCIFVGSAGNCTILFDDKLSVHFIKTLLAYNVNFRTRFVGFYFRPDSIVKLIHCSFTSSNPTKTSFCCLGKLKVEHCKFQGCTQGGLLVVGDAEVESSEFYGNGAGGLEVREGGRLIVKKSRMYANKQGLMIGPSVKECIVEECELYDNQWGGIVVASCVSCVTIRKNRMYDNDEPGISVMAYSNVFVLENEILKNSDWGISISEYSHAVVKRNKIQHNQCGGICVDATSSPRKSVLEYNDISFNDGPGIHDEGSSTICRENKLQENKEERDQSTAESEAKLCYYCTKAEKNLKKCTKCYTAQYCGKICQKRHWKSHKKSCNRLLSDGSVVLEYVRKPLMTRHLIPNARIPEGNRGRGLLPVGPKYCPPPNTMTRFIVKMSAGVPIKEGKEYDPSVVRLYDRSLKIDGILTGADQIYHLVRQQGAMGQLFTYWRKLFMWVKGPEHGKLRVFTKEFPSYQHW